MSLFQTALFATQKPRLFDSVRHASQKYVDRNYSSGAPDHAISSRMRPARLAAYPEISAAPDAQDLALTSTSAGPRCEIRTIL